LLEVALMSTNATRLSDRQLKAVKATGEDLVLSDGDGLQLRVRASCLMMWNFNYREPLARSRINMALGPYLDLSLANARKKAAEARELPALGTDPKTKLDEARQAKLAETEHTFVKVATAWFPALFVTRQLTPHRTRGPDSMRLLSLGSNPPAPA